MEKYFKKGLYDLLEKKHIDFGEFHGIYTMSFLRISPTSTLNQPSPSVAARPRSEGNCTSSAKYWTSAPPSPPWLDRRWETVMDKVLRVGKRISLWIWMNKMNKVFMLGTLVGTSGWKKYAWYYAWQLVNVVE